MDLILIPIIYAIGAYVWVYFDGRFDGDTSGLAPVWPVVLPMMAVIWTFYWVHSLGQKHARR